MTNTGHEARARAIRENIERRAQVTNTTEVVRELDKTELEMLRDEVNTALHVLAQEVGAVKSVILEIGIAAEKELKRK